MEKTVCVIYADYNSGELSRIKWKKDFKKQSNLFKADVLKDIIGELEVQYNTSVNGFVNNLSKI
jgi:hypothetical protein